jgi:hypothetical protein
MVECLPNQCKAVSLNSNTAKKRKPESQQLFSQDHWHLSCRKELRVISKLKTGSGSIHGKVITLGQFENGDKERVVSRWTF